MAFDKTKYIRARIERVLLLADECDNDEIKAELACFAAVLTSGLIESTCRHLLLSYTTKRAAPQVVSYVESNLYYFQNAKVTKLQELFGMFDRAFADRLQSDLSEDETAAIDSVVNNKNNLAHGENPGLSLVVMREYFRLVCRALDKIGDLCG